MSKTKTGSSDMLITSEQVLFPTYLPLADGVDAFVIGQNKLITTNKTDATLNHYYIFNKTNHINFTVGGSHTWQSFTSALDQRDGNEVIRTFDQPEYGKNDVEFWLTDAFTSVHYKWKKGKFTTSPGLNLHFYNIRDEQEGTDV